MEKNFEDFEKNYSIDLEKIVNFIKKERARKILLQFSDGLKPYASAILDKLYELTKNLKQKPVFFIWLGSCFGACDVPNVKNVDLIIQFGHSSLKAEI